MQGIVLIHIYLTAYNLSVCCFNINLPLSFIYMVRSDLDTVGRNVCWEDLKFYPVCPVRRVFITLFRVSPIKMAKKSQHRRNVILRVLLHQTTSFYIFIILSTGG